MSELKTFDIVVSEENGFEGKVTYRRTVYDKSEADKVIADLEESHKKEVEQLLIEIAELKNRIAPRQSDKTLQERLNEVCEKHGVSSLQDLDWAFCESEKRRTIDSIEAVNMITELKDKALQYKVLYEEKCRDINNQEQHFSKQLYHHKYNRCLDKAKLCQLKMGIFFYHEKKNKFYYRWHKRWLELAEKFKEGV